MRQARAFPSMVPQGPRLDQRQGRAASAPLNKSIAGATNNSKRHHRRNGIPRQTEHRLALAHSKHGRLPRPDRPPHQKRIPRPIALSTLSTRSYFPIETPPEQHERIFFQAPRSIFAPKSSIRFRPHSPGLPARRPRFRTCAASRDAITVSNLKLFPVFRRSKTTSSPGGKNSHARAAGGRNCNRAAAKTCAPPAQAPAYPSRMPGVKIVCAGLRPRFPLGTMFCPGCAASFESHDIAFTASFVQSSRTASAPAGNRSRPVMICKQVFPRPVASLHCVAGF